MLPQLLLQLQLPWLLQLPLLLLLQFRADATSLLLLRLG